MQRGILVFAFSGILIGAVWGQTVLPATISENLTLSVAESPYVPEQNVTINAGVTPTIEAGVQILMSSGASINNSGRFIVLGSEFEEVLITSKSSSERWNYIHNQGTLNAKYLHINSAVRFLSSYGDTVLIDNCTVTNTYGGVGDDCIGAHNADKVIISNSWLEGNPDAGKTDAIDLDNIAGDTIIGNVIFNFSDDGIDIGTGSLDVVISANDISNCDVGISIGESTTAEVDYNLIHHCTSGLQSHYASVMNAQNNTLFANGIGLRAYHNSSEETSGGTIHCSNTIISGSKVRLISTKENSFVETNYCLTDSTKLEGLGNMMGDPLFVDTLTNNYSLLAGSPAIDAGDPDSDSDGEDFNTDRDDRDPDDSRKDMGAFPFFNTTLRIIEISSSNLSVKQDENGDYPDWITLYNDSDVPYNLKGYYLSDNPANPKKYQIDEDLMVGANDSLLFWADNSAFPTGNRLPFKLSGEGEYVRLSNSAGVLLDHKMFGRIPVDHVYQRLALSDQWVYISKDDPSIKYDGICGDVHHNYSGGEVDFPLSVTLSSVIPEEQVFYSVDGRDPLDGELISGEITVTDPMTLRARATSEGKVPGYVQSRVFFEKDKYKLPLMSISTNNENLFLPGFGIYSAYSMEGPLWERPASFNYYDDAKHFGAVAGIRIQGGNSVHMPKKSFRLHFRGGYGSSRLDGTPFLEGPGSFKNLVLRAGYDDDITTSGGTMLRDPFSCELWERLGELATKSTFSVLLLNNSYWGIYNVRESINNYFVEDHIGRGDFDLVRFQKDGPDLKYGTIDEWDRLVEYFDVTDFTKAEVYNEVAEFMDMNSLLNLLAFVHCSEFRSWTWGAFMVKPNGGKWSWTIWDTDRSFERLDWNGFTKYAYSSAENWSNFIPRNLIKNQQFRNELINRNCDFLNTLFIPEIAIGIYDSLVSVIAPEMEAEFERWNPGNISNWEVNNEKVRSFLRDRPSYVYDQMKAYFSLKDTVGIEIRIEGNGKVKLNSIVISDPEWHGVYMKGNNISLEALPNKGAAFVEWEELTDASKISEDPADIRTFVAKFTDIASSEREPLIINEIMYHPVHAEQSEWIEIYNPNDFALSLDGFVFKDANQANRMLLSNVNIEEKGYMILAGNLNDFTLEFPNVRNVTGSFNSGDDGFNLSNSGEQLYLLNNEGRVEDSVRYFDVYPWPNLADGFGPSLQLLDPKLDNMNGTNWLSNNVYYVSPGRSNNVNDVKNVSGFEEHEILLYPNPVRERMNLEIFFQEQSELHCRIYTVSGKLVSEYKTELLPSLNTVSWEHGLRNKGAYFLQLEIASESRRIIQTRLFIY